MKKIQIRLKLISATSTSGWTGDAASSISTLTGNTLSSPKSPVIEVDCLYTQSLGYTVPTHSYWGTLTSHTQLLGYTVYPHTPS